MLLVMLLCHPLATIRSIRIRGRPVRIEQSGQHLRAAFSPLALAFRAPSAANATARLAHTSMRRAPLRSGIRWLLRITGSSGRLRAVHIHIPAIARRPHCIQSDRPSPPTATAHRPPDWYFMLFCCFSMLYDVKAHLMRPLVVSLSR